MKKALTIAGSDSCGGAGIQADLKTFSANGVYGMSVITAVTAQNTQGVFAVQDIDVDIIEKQMDAIFEDIEVDAVKIGMVSQEDTIKSIGKRLELYKPINVVLDPVMISKSGYDLLQPDARQALIDELIPKAFIITPNLPEAEAITGMTIRTLEDMKQAAAAIADMGAQNVLIKGGHLDHDATDVLYDGREYKLFPGKRILTKNTHGTGCTLSSAIASYLTKGLPVEAAVAKSKEYISMVIEHSFSIGKGVGPTHHFYDLYKKAEMETT